MVRVIYIFAEDGNTWAFVFFVGPELPDGVEFEYAPPDCGEPIDLQA